MGEVGTVAIYPHYGASFQVILFPQDSDSTSQKTYNISYHPYAGGTTIYVYGGQTYSLFEEI